MIDISLDSFRAARDLLKKNGIESPLLPFYGQSTPQGSPILLKADSLLPTGSFKIRGATYAISKLSLTQKARGVVTSSTGNHAQAIAYAARQFKTQATIVMSPDVPENKINATLELGARVVMAEPTSKARAEMAAKIAKEEECPNIPAFDHIDVITGQGTSGLEILEKVTPSIVFVPIGGGGLISGIAMVLKKNHSSIRVIGVEPELENDAYQSFKLKQRVALPGPSHSLADAIKIQTLGELTYPLVMHYVDDIVTVNEQQIAEATLLTAEKAHLIVEPAGALALAAALTYKNTHDPQKPVVCLASGGNISLAGLCALQL